MVLLGGPVPLYYQLTEHLRERIAAGEWRPGDQIPTIRELCQQYSVSRMTVIQALNLLAREGLLVRRQGKGVFVAEPKVEHGPVRLLSFTEETLRRGHTPTSRVLLLERRPAEPDIAARLDLPPGETVVVLRRLRLADGEPMGVQTAFLPDRLCPGLADLTEPISSLYRLLQERYGLIPTRAVETYEPVRLDAATAALLGVPRGAPAFSVERLTRDQYNRPIEYVVSMLRGDRYKVVLELQRTGV